MSSDYYSRMRQRFIVTVFSVLLVMAGLFWWQASREKKLAILSAGRSGGSYSAALSEHAERVFSEVDSSLKELIEELDEQGGVKSARTPAFYRIIRDRVRSELQFSSIYVLDREGNRVAHSAEYPAKSANLADRPYFRHHVSTPDSGLFISPPYLGSVNANPHFSVSRAVRGVDGRFNGLVSLTVETSYFDKFYQGLDVGPRGSIILATVDGNILSCVSGMPGDFSKEFTALPIISAWLPSAPSGIHQVTSNISGDKRIIVYRKLERFPVVAVISYSQDDVLAAWKANVQKQGVIALVLTLLALSIASLFLRQLNNMESANHKLRLNQDELQLKSELLDTASDAVLLLDTQANFLYFNKALSNMTGYAPEELQQLGLHGIEPPEYAARIRDNISSLLEHGEAFFESAYLLKSGDILPIEVHARLTDINGRTLVLSMVRDMTERKESEHALVKIIDDLKKAEHREHVRSEILERIAGAEPLQQQLSFIAGSIERDNPELLCSIMLISEDGKRLLNVAAPGLSDFFNIAAHTAIIGERFDSCGASASRRERIIVEDFDRHTFWKDFKPAQEAGLRSCWWEPVISSAGQLIGVFVIYHRTPSVPAEDEISLVQQAAAFAAIAIERSRGEEERMELEHLLGQSQKMEAIGHLSGGIAHDFNNLLTPVLVYADMLKRSLPENDKARSQLDGIMKASRKARDLTLQLLSFGRKQVMQMRVVDLNDVIMSFHSMVSRTVPENICISLQLSSQPAVVRADSSKLEQVLLNLVLNAQDAIAVNGSISIETGHILIDDEFARRHPGLNAGRFVLLACADNGCGMSAETVARIFEPFFSTKEVGHGTGLGLANVYGIVKQHNGYIMAVSTVGIGTTFKIYLPACDDKPDLTASVTQDADLDHSGNAVILLVEDNEMVRVMSSELLEGLGYTVHSADHPERALELVGNIREKVDLVITDVVMPGMNGQQLFERIRADHPEIDKVLYMSGYTNSVIIGDSELDSSPHFLQKPFTVDALMAKVNELLQPGINYPLK